MKIVYFERIADLAKRADSLACINRGSSLPPVASGTVSTIQDVLQLSRKALDAYARRAAAELVGGEVDVPVTTPLNLPLGSLELDAGEIIPAQNPNLIRIAQIFTSFQSYSTDADLRVSANLAGAAKMKGRHL